MALADWASIEIPITARERWLAGDGQSTLAPSLWTRSRGTPNEWSPELPEPQQLPLLDWLAGELLCRDGDLKAIQRLIVTSAAYQADREPSLRALDAEALRDSLLAVSGLLDDRVGGPVSRRVRFPGGVCMWPVQQALMCF